MDLWDEQALISSAQRGDDGAYERLLETLVDPAHKLACGLLHDSYLAEDAVQEASVKAWRKLNNLRPGASMRPWFLAIVANQCKESKRGHWARLIPRSEFVELVDSPDDAILDRIQIRQVLERLNRDERLVLVLRLYVDLPWPEVAAIARVTEAGARTRLYRALAKIRPSKKAAATT
jgi:RNA polymerase sigma-70 factor (ECF subfamily)